MNNKKNQTKVSYIDVIIVFIVCLLSFFFTQSWNHQLAGVFHTLIWVIFVVYLLAWSTGIFSNLILRTPTWTITGLLSIPVWLLVSIIPIQSSTVPVETTGSLAKIFGEQFVSNFTNVFLIPWAETIVIIGFIIVVFLRQNSKNSPRITTGFGKNQTKDKKYGLIMLFIAFFGGILHYNVALILSETAKVAFDYFLLHQILSFFIFAFIALSPLGLAGAIASHVVKNALAGGSMSFLFAMFVFFIIMDWIAFKTNKKDEIGKKIMQTTSGSLGV